MFLANWILDFEEVALVHDLEDEFLDVVGLVGVVGDQRVERGLGPVGAVLGRQLGHAGFVVCRQEIQQASHLQQCLDVVLVSPVRNGRLRGVHAGAAQLLGRHGLVGNGLHHVRPGHEHVARVLHHEDEIGHGRRVDIAAGARPHDDRDLRDDAGRQHVAQEYLAVPTERGYPLLDARAARIEQPDDGGSVLQRHVLDLHDLPGVRLRQRPAEHGEVLGEHVDDATVDGAPARDHAVARDLGLLHAEVVAAVLDVHVELLEGVVVHQELDALPRGELAAFVLGVDACLSAPEPRRRPTPLQFFQHFLHESRPDWIRVSKRHSTGVLRCKTACGSG